MNAALAADPRADLFTIEHELKLAGGTSRWVSVRGEVIERSGDKARLVEGVLVDIDNEKRRALRLERAYDKLRYHLENTPVATVEWNERFQVLRWSESAEQLFGWTAAEVLGKTPAEWRFVHDDDVATVTAKMAELASGVLKRAFLLNRNYTKDGEVRWTEWYTSVLREGESGELSLLSRALDVTNREKAFEALKQSEGELQGLADAIPHSVWTTLPDGAITFLNRHWSRVTGVSAGDDLTVSWRRSVHPDDLEGLDVTWKAALKAMLQFEGEVRLSTPPGVYRWHLVRCVPVRDEGGRVVRWVGTATDIDDQHRLQSELKKQAMELSHSNQVLQQLAYAAAHDLQEPIRTTSSFAGLLERRCGGQLDANGHEYLRLIQDGNARMASLVKSLLSYAQDSTGPLRVSEVAMERAVSLTVADLRARIEETEAQITWDALPSVLGDEPQLVRLLQNLLVNAIHYRQEGRPPRIEVRVAEQGPFYVFCVRDNGVGIEPEYREQIFGLFKRLHGMSLPGSGIGLASCRQIVERHGGKIWVESVPGEGSSFYFSLPRAPKA